MDPGTKSNIYLDNSRIAGGICYAAPYADASILKKPTEALYAVVGADEDDTFVFTSSGAEAMSTVFSSHYFETIYPSGKNHIILSKSAEAAIYLSAEKWKKVGCALSHLAPNAQGQITWREIEPLITPRTGLVSLSWAEGDTGVIHPIWEIAENLKKRGISLHVDVSHVLGKLYFRLRDLPIDYLTFDGPLIHAPIGTGALFLKGGVPFSPLIPDGNEQGGLRGGTLDAPALQALANAALALEDAFDHMSIEGTRLRDRLEAGIPDVHVHFQNSERLPHVLAVSFPGISGELLQFALSKKGIFTSRGGGRSQSLSSQLLAAGVDPILAHAALSFSLSRETTEEDIEATLAALRDILSTYKPLTSALLP